ncbi:MAG TPA: chemotaxis protein CheD [Spirochaetota bacterium]|nr:chemotaxis protein CheD [Spirochaetota bacterium]OPZ35391.1 MAG: Chemoreceptor glutamine deamidase CheD [Spirochaetes bacterium ADurb.BinA120]HNU92845.1 chemotaxis protein CheD [Spirochaetota bacterium]HPO45986.1 chemotaxis protein CheD [Spirochaetota bacterium]HPV99151.1 chemotaxis protein CheD [Spirochaetota bacterium]
MHIRNSHKYGKPVKIIHPGEYYVSGGDEIIGTLLGSCIAVCLHDPERAVSGMNHFMLPGRISGIDIAKDKTAKYGITAINKLIKELEKIGADRGRLMAKIFGGGKVLDGVISSSTIPSDNIRLAKVMMEMEDIQIQEIDVGGIFTRKILMDVKTGGVYLKKSTRKEVIEEIEKQEADYARKIAGKA